MSAGADDGTALASAATRDGVKIILLGDSAVGKSKLVERFLMDGYQPQQLSTYALTLFPYEAEVDGRKVPVDFWDTAGQERFNSLHPSYYYQAHACILAFDVTRKLTYKNLSSWFKELQEHRKNIPCIVVANKIDLDRKATTKSFNFATKRNLDFYYVSAADGTNVVKVFNEAIRKGLECKEKPPDDFFDEVMEFLHEDDRPAAQPAAQRAPLADTPANGADQQGTTPGADSAAATTLSLTVPEGVEAGQQLQIEAPDGRTLLITVPEGVTAGQQLEVSV